MTHYDVLWRVSLKSLSHKGDHLYAEKNFFSDTPQKRIEKMCLELSLLFFLDILLRLILDLKKKVGFVILKS